MNDGNEVTRRDFLLSTAMITASSAVGHAQPVLGALMGQETASEATMPTAQMVRGSSSRLPSTAESRNRMVASTMVATVVTA